MASSQYELEQGAKFLIEYQKNIMECRCMKDSDTFASIKPKVAQYFTLREDLIFFADEKESIYMEDMNILETLFPLINAQTTGVVPKIKVLL